LCRSRRYKVRFAPPRPVCRVFLPSCGSGILLGPPPKLHVFGSYPARGLEAPGVSGRALRCIRLLTPQPGSNIGTYSRPAVRRRHQIVVAVFIPTNASGSPRTQPLAAPPSSTRTSNRTPPHATPGPSHRACRNPPSSLASHNIIPISELQHRPL
jgi:hypothetical protein